MIKIDYYYNETDVINRIIDFVSKRDDVRASILIGSRANPNAPKDDFQDFDVCLLVRDPEIFLKDQSWIDFFGSVLIRQVNPSPGEKIFLGESTKNLTFLILFKEGFRIDFGFLTLENFKEVLEDSLCQILVDKDQIIPLLPQPNDNLYWVKKPSKELFNFVVNEFWWCLTNVGKGLIREELPYVKGMFDEVVKPVYIQMIKWYIGYKYDWKVNVGKFGKWIKRYLPIELYQEVEKSYPNSNYSDIWDSVFASGKLFRKCGLELAEHLGFEYPLQDDINVMDYLSHIQKIHLK